MDDDDIYRTAIKKTWTCIMDSVTKDQAYNIMDCMVENNILDAGMREWIERDQSKTCINRKLFGLVSKKGPRAFHLLIEVLLQNQLSRIAEKLLSNIVEQPAVLSSSSSINFVKSDQDVIMECNICMTDKKSVALIPCGHTFCNSCGVRFF